MSNKTIGHIFFILTLLLIFGAFGVYAVFYKTTSFFIKEGVEKTLFWSKLFNSQLELRQKTINQN